MNDNEYGIVTLEITSWIGIGLGARHYYGKLIMTQKNGERESIGLTYQLTEKQAKRLNSQEKSRLYGKGSSYAGFDSEDDVRERARSSFRALFPHAKVLIEGSRSAVEPKRILVPEKYEKASVDLVDKMDKLYGGNPNPRSWKELDKLTEEYEKLLDMAIHE